MAKELLHELAPLLAEEGIDVNNIGVPDLETLQQALNRRWSGAAWRCSRPSARELAAVTARQVGSAQESSAGSLSTRRTWYRRWFRVPPARSRTKATQIRRVAR